ncbi:MAG TPA: aldehyde reductase [Draconibacterium sp.]|nr:aldehyde reductase [Draconibacterium sp.]
MKIIDKTKPILVTGATGYLASWVVKQLLDEGLTVHGTVRNKANTKKYEHLLDLAAKSNGSLEIFEADLLNEGSFEKAMQNCELVLHTASPFQISGIKDPQNELVEPALKGTRNVLHTVSKTESVKRVVFTSSMAAIYGDSIDCKEATNGVLTEDVWNTTSSLKHQPYSYSKTLAEKEAWKIAEAQQRWDLVVINPGFILGPSLDKNNFGVSNEFISDLGNGKFKFGVPKGTMGMVDVRDVARAHILAGFTPTARGRHITAGYCKSFFDVVSVLRKKYPELPLPSKPILKTVAWLVGPLFGLTRKHVSKNFNIDLKFDNSYVQKDLGLKFTPLEKTLNDHFEQMIADGVIKRT